jgi:hypothetical protein
MKAGIQHARCSLIASLILEMDDALAGDRVE